MLSGSINKNGLLTVEVTKEFADAGVAVNDIIYKYTEQVLLYLVHSLPRQPYRSRYCP